MTNEINITAGFTSGKSTIDLLTYANGIAIIANNIEEVKSSCQKLRRRLV